MRLRDFNKMADNWRTEWDAWLKTLGKDAQRKIPEPPPARVVKVQFGLLSSNEIERLSSVEVKQAATQKVGIVQRDGVTDSRLGTTQRSMLCGTCGCTHELCAIGHSGHIRLCQPVPNGEYLTFTRKLLEMVCYNCCQLRMPKDFPGYADIVGITSDKERMKRIFTICRRRTTCETWRDTKRRRKIQGRCRRRGTTYAEEEQKLAEEEQEMRQKGQVPEDDVDLENLTAEEIMALGRGCGAHQPYWIREEGIILRPVFTLTADDKARWAAKDPAWAAPVFTPDDMFRMLDNVSDEVITLMGMNPQYARPSSLIWRNFYVPTVNIRPSKTGKSGNNRCPNEDDLTLRLKAIERANSVLQQRLKDEEKAKGRPAVINIAKYRWEGREFNTPDEAFAFVPGDAKPAAAVKKAAKAADTPYGLWDKMYRCCTTYQDNKLKGQGVVYGKERKSIRCRFRGRKKTRVCGTVTGKRCVLRDLMGVSLFHYVCA